MITIEDIRQVEKLDIITIIDRDSNIDISLYVTKKNDNFGNFVIYADMKDNLEGNWSYANDYHRNYFEDLLNDSQNEITITKQSGAIINGTSSPKETTESSIGEILAIDINYNMPIIITGINQVSKIYTPKSESEYVYDYIGITSGIGADISRDEFFVTHDIIEVDYLSDRETIKIENISRFLFPTHLLKISYKILKSANIVFGNRLLTPTFETDVETFGQKFSNYKVIEYYNLHELLEKPNLVKSTPQLVNIISDNYKKEISEINRNIADALFLKSITSPIDFETKIELGQSIDKMQKNINNLNFKIVERKLTDIKFFDDLFEQSFTEIKHTYNDMYSVGESDFFAPNGSRSELSNELNELIRTPQFKEWFGDWELSYLYKDVESFDIPCSKVVNENYEPLLVWHGTGAEFSYFRFDNVPAAYFARKQEYSQWFANLQGGDNGYTIPFFLNIRNPLDLTHFGTKQVLPKDFFDFIFVETGFTMEYLDVNPIFFESSIPALPIWVILRRNPAMLKKLAESNVFDGIHFFETNPNVPISNIEHETEAFITFDPSQCKIADSTRGEILLASLKSFLLKRGGKI